LIYALLIRIGLPPSTVLAFSAVPGLAIGLGAQRILGNLFSGISIQTDRPVRIGDFCKVDNQQGFVTRIGLRSIELSTFSGRVTIPNSMFDSATIQSFSKPINSESGPIDSDNIGQNIELQLEMPAGLGISHLNSIVERITDYAENQDNISKISCSFCENDASVVVLSIGALSKTNQDWDEYLYIRQMLVSEIRLIVSLIKNTKQMISVGRQTKPHLIKRIPSIIETIVNEDPLLSLSYCRLSSISDYSLDFAFNIHTKYTNIGDFLDAVAVLKQKILQSFSNNGIHIPYPTSVELATNPFEIPMSRNDNLSASQPNSIY
jgi:MscS family membrane protein